MTENLIPADVRAFIVEHIHSIAEMEMLLLLRANPAAQWTADQIARRIYTPEPTVAKALERMCGEGFLACAENLYRYDVRDDARRDLVDRMATLYSSHLIPVTNVIHDRDRHLREFSDAFKLKKET